LKVPVVVSERIHPPAMPIGPLWPRLRRWTYPWAASVVMQTRRSGDWLATECPTARVAVIPNPCVYPLPLSEPWLDPADWVPQARRVLLAVGRLDEQKGFAELIDAFGRPAARFPDWDLVILGEGGERAALEARVEQWGLTERVALPGRVGNLADWYQRAELYVMSSLFEGFPNTLLEAMAHGLPAVSFDCETGPADIIREGIDGILVSPADGEAGLAGAMSAMMQDDDRRQRMGRAAVTVRDRFSPERVMAEWDDVLALSKESADV
jgi:glycosyltransferase involved in cell wall biosynthesis